MNNLMKNVERTQSSFIDKILMNFEILKPEVKRVILQRDFVTILQRDFVTNVNINFYFERLTDIKNYTINNLNNFIYDVTELMNYNRLFNSFFTEEDIIKIIIFSIDKNMFSKQTYIASISILNLLTEKSLAFLVLKGYPLPNYDILMRRNINEDNKKQSI